jgi:hypothetical protein
MQSTLACLYLAFAIVAASTIEREGAAKAQTIRYVVGHTGYNMTGAVVDIIEYSPDLSLDGVDNAISSACLTGSWIIYDEINYGSPGSLSCASVGISSCLGDLGSCSGVASSVRYAGSPDGLNAEFVNLYEGDGYTGDEFQTGESAISVGNIDQKVSSLIISGTSEWTFFTGLDFTGASLCVSPQQHLVHEDGTVLDYTLVAQMADIGLPDNSIRSLLKGCVGGPRRATSWSGAASQRSPDTAADVGN